MLAIGIDDHDALDFGIFEGGFESLEHGCAFSLVVGQPDQAHGKVEAVQAAIGAAIVDDNDPSDYSQDVAYDGTDVWPGVVAGNDNGDIGAREQALRRLVHET
jgi:hypothetical protein